MLTDTPEELRPPIVTDPKVSIQMTVTKLTRKENKVRASQLKASQAASQVSIAEAFKRMAHSSQSIAPPKTTQQTQKQPISSQRNQTRLLESGYPTTHVPNKREGK